MIRLDTDAALFAMALFAALVGFSL
jgi:hypothetical protein